MEIRLRSEEVARPLFRVLKFPFVSAFAAGSLEVKATLKSKMLIERR
jgi:hypothetical protein